MNKRITDRYGTVKKIKISYNTEIQIKSGRIARIGNKEKVFCGIVIYFIQVVTLD